MIELLTRMTDPELTKMKPQREVYYKGLWFTFAELAAEKEFKDLNLRPDTIGTRWKNGARTIEKLMEPARKYYNKTRKKEEKTERVEFDPKEGCTPEQWAAMESGLNKDLLEL